MDVHKSTIKLLSGGREGRGNFGKCADWLSCNALRFKNLFEWLAYEIPLSVTIPAAKITTLRGLHQCLQVDMGIIT
jgi:hypothetical protein